MPIYEYRCRGCQTTFELVSLPGRAAAPRCPACQADDPERVISGFAVSSDQTRRSNIASARKRHAASQDRQDQRRADAEELREHVQELRPPKE